MHLFQSEIYESDDSDMPIVSPSSIRLPPPPVNYIFGAPIYKGTFNITGKNTFIIPYYTIESVKRNVLSSMF
jgi:hypothetical protein